MLIGPEGGFTERECELIESAGGRAVHLNDATLRIETAAVAAAVIWSARRQDRRPKDPTDH